MALSFIQASLKMNLKTGKILLEIITEAFSQQICEIYNIQASLCNRFTGNANHLCG